MSVTVTLSQSQAEKLLAVIEECERCMLEVRSILRVNTASKPTMPDKSYGPSIDGIKWRVKGGGIAEPGDDFAFDFVSDRDVRIPKEKKAIVDHVKQGGPLRVDEYEVTLSKDGKFLQRKKV